MSTSPGARRRRRCFDRDSRSYPDLDPGLAPYLARTEQITEKQFYEMVNHESGLPGISEISSDMRDLLAQETADVRAAEAVALFYYQTNNGSAPMPPRSVRLVLGLGTAT